MSSCIKCRDHDVGLGSHLPAFPFKAIRSQCVCWKPSKGSEEGCASGYSYPQDHRQNLPSILLGHPFSVLHLPTAYSQPPPKTHTPLSVSELAAPERLDRAEPKACCEGDGPSPSSPGLPLIHHLLEGRPANLLAH